MSRDTWLLPVLSAAYWGNCEASKHSDWRAAICGFCGAAAVLIAARALAAWLNQELGVSK